RRRHPRFSRDWSSDVCSSDLGEMAPIVDAAILPSGELGVFRGEGSVRLRTEEIDLRSNELTYDAIGQSLEATTNVYFKQDTLERSEERRAARGTSPAIK